MVFTLPRLIGTDVLSRYSAGYARWQHPFVKSTFGEVVLFGCKVTKNIRGVQEKRGLFSSLTEHYSTRL